MSSVESQRSNLLTETSSLSLDSISELMIFPIDNEENEDYTSNETMIITPRLDDCFKECQDFDQVCSKMDFIKYRTNDDGIRYMPISDQNILSVSLQSNPFITPL